MRSALSLEFDDDPETTELSERRRSCLSGLYPPDEGPESEKDRAWPAWPAGDPPSKGRGEFSESALKFEPLRTRWPRSSSW